MLFDLLRIALLSAVIGYAAYSDHKTGEVANKVWLYLPVGLALTGVSLISSPALLPITLLSFLATILISLPLFYIGGWGGADAKAFLTIGFSLPIAPFSILYISLIYPLTVVLLSAVIAYTINIILGRQFARFLPYVFLSMWLALIL